MFDCPSTVWRHVPLFVPLGFVGFKPDHLAVIGGRLGRFSGIQVYHRALEVGLGVFAVELQCLVEIGQGLVDFVLPCIDDAATEPLRRALRTQLHAPIEVVKRLVEIVFQSADKTPLAVRVGVVGVEFRA